MKIGFSLGRCVRDIVTGSVSIDDVAFIIAATAIREKEKLRPVIQDYTWRDGYLYGLDEEVCQSVAEQLWDQRKILQPRLQGLQRHMQPRMLFGLICILHLFRKTIQLRNRGMLIASCYT